jgi:DNA-binding XRE family transcriptional regulator
VGIWHHWNHRRLRSEGASLMPAARSFSDLTKDFSPERRERIEQRKQQLRQDMSLAEPRKAFSLTQDTLAKNLNVKQAEISKIENRADLLMSTLRNFVQTIGGELEPRAVFLGFVI